MWIWLSIYLCCLYFISSCHSSMRFVCAGTHVKLWYWFAVIDICQIYIVNFEMTPIQNYQSSMFMSAFEYKCIQNIHRFKMKYQFPSSSSRAVCFLFIGAPPSAPTGIHVSVDFWECKLWQFFPPLHWPSPGYRRSGHWNVIYIEILL